MSYISWNAPFPLTISSNLNESIVEKQLYAGKVPSVPTFGHHKRQYFELLVKEIKCRYSTADLCAQIYGNMLISSNCSLLTGQFAQWREHGKSYCVGVRCFMFEAWLFHLAHRARLPDTVDFVLYELFNIFAYICAQRSAVEYRHLISYTRSSKYCRLW